MLPVVTTQAVPSGADLILFARVVGTANTPITSATVSSITVQVTDLTKETQLTGSGAVATTTPAVVGTVFDSLQQGDAAWTKDSATAPGTDGQYGYNFRYIVPGANNPGSGDRLQADVHLSMVGGGIIKVVYEWPTTKTFA